jgi:nicotinate-nucleotide adenylyltransferase
VRVGIFGGSFDPVHEGHLRPVDAIVRELALDRVCYVPNNRSPFKEAVPPADARHRVAMLALALAGRPRSVISFCELDRPGVSYTVDTLRQLSGTEDELFFLLGTDALAGLGRWKEPGQIARLARLAAFVREPFSAGRALADPAVAALRDSILIFDSVRVTISSSELRQSVSRGEPITGKTPKAVEEYIFKHGLYKTSRGTESG